MSERRRLQAGRWDMLFEPESGFLRRVAWRGGAAEYDEVLRGIYVAVRNHNWDTLPVSIDALEIDESPEKISIRFRASHDVFEWSGSIDADASGSLRYQMDGAARSTFRRNRIGFCVLHPPECAGLACTIQSTEIDAVTGGYSEIDAEFPEDISPHQPFQELRALHHTTRNGTSVWVQFEGDVFETEDQRNWTDASFKTYCTPLHLPFPVEVRKGDVVRQAIELCVESSSPASDVTPISIATPESAERVLTIHEDEPTTFLPAIGLAASDASETAGPAELGDHAARLAALGLSHLRVELDLADEGWRRSLDRGLTEARAIGLPLELVTFLSERFASELGALDAALAACASELQALLVLRRRGEATSADCLEQARSVLAKHRDDVPLVSGTNAYFTELNRGRPAVDLLDGVVYSLNPQVHAFDDMSLLETLPVQAVTVDSARRFCSGLPLRISPITLQPRFNPNATGPEDPSPPDPRQRLPFAAVWTFGSLKHLAKADLESVTYFETTGDRGVAGFPVSRVFELVRDFRDAEVLDCESSHPLEFDALALERRDGDGRRRVIVANFRDAATRVRIGRDFLELEPYGLAAMDTENATDV